MLLIVSGVFWHHPSHPRDTQYCIRVDDNEYGVSLIPSDVLGLFCRNRQIKLAGVVGAPVYAVLDLIGYRRKPVFGGHDPGHAWQRLDIRGLYPDSGTALDDFWKLGGKATLRDNIDGEVDWRPMTMLPEDYYAL